MTNGCDRASGAGNYAEVNGLEMYYEVHGVGEPLILLHGGVGAIEMFGEVLPQLAEGRRIVAVDLQAHGRTADVDRPLSFESMADDVAALIRHLGFEKADVMGYSLGGGVALQAAIRHPEVVRKLVLVSTPFGRDGWYPEVLAGMGQMGPEAAEPMKQTPMYGLYAGVAPRPEDWPVLLTKLGQLLRQDYDWSEDVAAMETPTMIVVGDADSVRTAHAVRFFELLGGGRQDAGWDGSGMPDARLAVLPGTTHYDIFSSPALASTVAPFLDAPMPEVSGRQGVTRVFDKVDLAQGETAVEFQGCHHDAGVSFILVDAPPGSGPKLHRHPYEEVFVVQEGAVTFTAGDEVIEASAGQIVVVPAGVPHKFVNSGTGSLCQIDIHPTERFATEWLED